METATREATTSIFVNGEAREVPLGCTIEQLLGRIDMAGRRVAVARNRDVVPRSTFAQATVSAGDRIEILEAVGGG